MPSAVDRLFVELRRFFEPLSIALASTDEFAAFLRRFGFAFDGEHVAGAVGQFAPMRASILELSARTRSALDDGLDAADVVAIANAARPLFQSIDSFHESLSGLAAPDPLSPADFAQALQALPEELFNILLTDYLTDYAPLVLHTLALLDVATTNQIPETDAARSRGIAYSVPEYRWDRFRLLLESPSEWAEQAYGWGVAFDSDLFIFRLVRVFEYLGGLAEIREMSEAQATVFVPDLASSPLKPTIALAPIVRTETTQTSDAGEFDAMNELGLALLPVAGPGDPSDAGIGVAPYTEGSIAQSIQLGTDTTLTLSGEIGAVGGVVFSFRPSGARVDVGVDETAFDTKVGVVLRYAPQATVVMVGQATGTRLQIVSAEAGLSADVIGNEVEVVARLETNGLSLVIAASDPDAFVGGALAGKETVIPFPLAVRWSSRTGLGLQGLRFAATVSPNLSIGPIRVETLSIAVYGEQPQGEALRAVLEVGAGISGAFGPVAFTLDGIGVQAIVVFADGNLGPVDVDQKFKPPTGVGLSVNASVVTGGGFLRFDPQKEEYSGILQLEIADTVAVKAIGLLTTRMPDGSKGFSLVVIIAAEGFAPIQLGFGFTLTGIGGLLGINRTVMVDVLRKGLKNGTLGSILFPADPIRNAPQIVSDLRAVFPSVRGRHFFGPMALIAWGTPTILTLEIGLLLELPEPVRLIILGRLQTVLPSADHALIRVRMDAIGVIDFNKEEVALDATLYDSRILEFVLTGDMALRANWGSQPNFVLAVGGFNPRFTAPAGFPQLARLALSLGDSDNPRLRFESYLALTSNTVQFGARFDFSYSAAGFTLAGFLGFDALFQFSPFGFIVDVGAMVALKRGGSVLMGLFLDMTLAGPTPWHIWGKATFKIFFFKVSIRFDHRFGHDAPPALPPAIDVMALLADALGDRRNWSSALPRGEHSIVSLRDAQTTAVSLRVHPLAELTVRQRVVPLRVPVTRFGNVPLGGQTTFTVATPGSAGSVAMPSTPTQDAFALSQYQEMSDEEKLARPAFERHDAGLQFAVEEAAYQYESLPDTSIAYETLIIDPTRPAETVAVTEPYVLPPMVLDAVVALGAAGQAAIRRRGSFRYRAPERAA